MNCQYSPFWLVSSDFLQPYSIYPSKCPFLHSLNPYIVDETAHSENAEYSHRGIEVIICIIIMTYTVHSVTPQPVTHGIAVGMDKQYAKGGGSYRIDEP